MLDPEAVHAFVLIADLGGFTRAAQALNTTQSAVSLKLKRLEASLGKRLIERTPRRVHLSSAGEAFLAPARRLVEAHVQAIEAFGLVRQRLAIGVTHHLVGPDLSTLRKRFADTDAGLLVEVRTDWTHVLLEQFDAGILDAVIVFQQTEDRCAGEVIGRERFAWFGTPDLAWCAPDPLPLAIQPAPCRLRATALAVLDANGFPWREAFVGGGAITTGAAAAAGLAVAGLARRAAPVGTIDLGPRLQLPALPDRPVVLHANVSDRRARRRRAPRRDVRQPCSTEILTLLSSLRLRPESSHQAAEERRPVVVPDRVDGLSSGSRPRSQR